MTSKTIGELNPAPLPIRQDDLFLISRNGSDALQAKISDLVDLVDSVSGVYFAATKAAGDTLASSLPDGATVIVTADESQGGVRVRYTVASAALTAGVPDTAAMVQFTPPSGTARAVGEELNSRRIDSIAALRAFSGRQTGDQAHVTSYYSGWAALTSGPSGGGRFVWDAASTATDDGGSVIAVTGVATGRWKRIFDNGAITFADFGAKGGDGTADDTATIKSALRYADGREVNASSGVYRITQSVTDGETYQVNVRGKTSAYLTNNGAEAFIANTHSSSYTDMPTPSIAQKYTVILCDGCSFIGSPDSGTVGAYSAVRGLRDCIVWGKSGAKIGVYTTGSDCQISGVCAVLFEWFGLASRGQITSSFTDITTVDCGWNLSSSGSAGYPATYYSGCGMIFLSNMTANDYTTISPAFRPTSCSLRNFFAWIRNHTATTKSGLRAIQAHGVIGGGGWDNVGGYTGSYYNICTSMEMENEYYEVYSTSGLVAGDATPHCNVFVNCNLNIGEGYLFLSNLTTNYYLRVDSNITGIPENITRRSDGVPTVIGRPFRPSITKAVTIATPGGTDNYTLSGVLQDSRGFAGFAAVSLVRKANYGTYSRAFFAAANHKAGGSGWQPMTSQLLHSQSTAGGTFTAVIGLSWSGRDLIVSVAWGNGWGVGVDFQLDVSLIGTGALSI